MIFVIMGLNASVGVVHQVTKNAAALCIVLSNVKQILTVLWIAAHLGIVVQQMFVLAEKLMGIIAGLTLNAQVKDAL